MKKTITDIKFTFILKNKLLKIEYNLIQINIIMLFITLF